MPTFCNGDASLYYEVHGSGFPVLLLPPGGLSSQISYWADALAFLSPHFKVIVMDQRNATERSRAPIRAEDGWHSYTSDHIALLDHLGVRRCHVMGMCIGPSFALALMKAAPERIVACVFVQPIGLAPESDEEGIPAPNNRQAFLDYNYENWVPKNASNVEPAVLEEFFRRLYVQEFVFSVSEEDVAKMPHPMLVLSGSDTHHPSFISRRLASVATNAVLLEDWKRPEKIHESFAEVLRFLRRRGSSPAARPAKPWLPAAGAALALLAAALALRHGRGKL